jgi:peroxiredoxin
MKMQWIAGLLLSVVATAIAAQQVQTAVRSGSVSVDVLASGASKSISYSDDQGRPIAKSAFLRAVMRGRQFSYKRNEASESTAFMLLAQDAKAKAMSAPALEGALRQDYKLKPGQAFPAFQLATADGGRVDNATLSGRPTVLHFFFAECVPCFVDVPVLNAYAQKHPEIRVLAVTRDDASTAASYVRQRHLAWPVAHAGQSLLDALGVTVFPAMALLSADGRLLDIRVSGLLQRGGGSLSERDLDRWVRGALSQQDSPAGGLSADAAPATTAAPAG